jgi:hypothetical protein
MIILLSQGQSEITEPLETFSADNADLTTKTTELEKVINYKVVEL